ncbi:hypothetical protein F8A91_14125 [Enterococcus faecium]|nr:hypothetical protein F8A91_14125 [Enterococcus faecium]
MVINQEVVIFLSLHNNIIDNSKKQNATDFSVAFRLYYSNGSIIYGTDESELILQPHFHFRY